MSLLPFYKKISHVPSLSISATRSQPLNVRGCVSSPSAMSWVSASAASQPALVWNKVQSLASKLYLPRTGATFLFPSHFRFSSFEDLYGVHFPDFKKNRPRKTKPQHELDLNGVYQLLHVRFGVLAHCRGLRGSLVSPPKPPEKKCSVGMSLGSDKTLCNIFTYLHVFEV